ncbi:mismatch-specific DNA-glycosylase [Limnobacter parvus]|uniref:Mismatch-specific DNA-glycosylase n=1 Tax=Limnobacter parvus TaxID=2939690 RepID=A0ABT1XJH7_9BURK|nr:mismatch-specific DNA-glycosylase [Limnobacter parvus]
MDLSPPAILPDLLAPHLNIVFCGTAPGTVSAQRGAYYANAGNAFWPTLFEVGLTPHRISAENFSSITRYKLGLTDLAKHVYGADSVLKKTDFGRDELRAKILQHAPKILAFTSKRAGQEYLCGKVQCGLQDEKIGNTVLFVLPSPSGLARSHWSITPWQDLAALAKQPLT